MDQNHYQYSLVEKLSFVRPGGTEEELRAARILLGEIEAAGGEGSLMEFQIPGFELETCAVKVCAPFEREIPAIPYGCAGSLPQGGKEFKLFYGVKAREEDLLGKQDLSDTAVLVDELKLEGYKRLCERKAGAVLVVTGQYYEDLTQCSAYTRLLREKFLDAVFKRHHDRHPDDLSRREAQKRNAIQWYYRRKLLKMVEENAETKIDE